MLVLETTAVPALWNFKETVRNVQKELSAELWN
jgi:hypothetical protein